VTGDAHAPGGLILRWFARETMCHVIDAEKLFSASGRFDHATRRIFSGEPVDRRPRGFPARRFSFYSDTLLNAPADAIASDWIHAIASIFREAEITRAPVTELPS